MDLFKLMGSVFVNNKDANSAIDATTQKAKTMSTTLGDKFKSVGDGMTNIGKKLAPLSLAVGGVMTGAIKSSMDYENSIAKVSTLVDTSQVSVDELSEMFLDLSNATGKSATELAEAGYQALSASVPVENLGKFTETASNLAKVGFTDATSAVDVLTTAVNAYGMSADDADNIAQNLILTQNLGKTSVNELASSMGKIIPTASSMNVNLDNLSAVYVSLTKQGIATAEATTYANSMFNELGKSSTDVGKILKQKTGKSFQDLMADGNSVANVLQILQEYADETGTNFNELWGSAEAGKSAIALLNGGVEEFNDTVETMASDVDVMGEGLKKLNTPSAKIQKSFNRLKNSGIKLGTAFTGALTPAIDFLSGVIEKASNWFNNLSETTQTVIAVIGGVVAVASPVLMIGGKVVSMVSTLIPVVKTLFAVLSANPIGLIVVAIVGIIAIIKHLWDTSESFRSFWVDVWEKIKLKISGAFEAIKGFWENTLKPAWDAMKEDTSEMITKVKASFTQMKERFNSIVNSIKGYWENTLKPAFQSLKSFIVDTVIAKVKVAFTQMKEKFNSVVNSIKSFWNENLKPIFEKIQDFIQTKVLPAFDDIKTFVQPIIENLSTAIGTVKDAIDGAIETVGGVVGAFESAFKGAYDKVKEWVDLIIEKVKEAGKAIAGLNPFASGNLPDVSVTIGADGEIVTEHATNYDTPALLKKPTMFATNHLGGDRGSYNGGEVVYGHDPLMNDIRQASAEGSAMLVNAVVDSMNKVYKILADYLPDMASKQPIIDINSLAPAIDTQLGVIAIRKGRGN